MNPIDFMTTSAQLSCRAEPSGAPASPTKTQRSNRGPGKPLGEWRGRGGGYWGKDRKAMIAPVMRELCYVLLLGSVNFSLLRGLSMLGFTGYLIRLAISTTLIVVVNLPPSMLPGAFSWNSSSMLNGFSQRLCPCLWPFPTDNHGRKLWRWFVWGKYTGVAALEICMCVACATASSWDSPHYASIAKWVSAALLAFNIAEVAHAHPSRILLRYTPHHWQNIDQHWFGSVRCLNTTYPKCMAEQGLPRPPRSMCSLGLSSLPSLYCTPTSKMPQSRHKDSASTTL